jgi:murein L,D-transpeptidase YcbB/YkuD
LGGRGRRISEFEVSLVYRVSSRTARATQRNPVWKKKEREREREKQMKKIARTCLSLASVCNNVEIKTYTQSQHLGGRGRRISEFEASLVYRMSSRTATATQRNPVSKNRKKKKKKRPTHICLG